MELLLLDEDELLSSTNTTSKVRTRAPLPVHTSMRVCSHTSGARVPVSVAFGLCLLHRAALSDLLTGVCSLLSCCLAAGKLPSGSTSAAAAAAAAAAALRAAVRVARAMCADSVPVAGRVGGGARAAKATSMAAVAAVARVSAAGPWLVGAVVAAAGGHGSSGARMVDF